MRAPFLSRTSSTNAKRFHPSRSSTVSKGIPTAVGHTSNHTLLPSRSLFFLASIFLVVGSLIFLVSSFSVGLPTSSGWSTLSFRSSSFTGSYSYCLSLDARRRFTTTLHSNRMSLQLLVLVLSFLCGLATHIFCHDADSSPTHHIPIALPAHITIRVSQCFRQLRIFFTLLYSKHPRRSLLSSAAIFTRFFFDTAFPGSSMTSSHLRFFCSATAPSNGKCFPNVSPSLAQYAILFSRKSLTRCRGFGLHAKNYHYVGRGAEKDQ